MDGEIITDSDWAGIFDSAMEAGGVAEMMVMQNWVCEDGSGAFDIEFHNIFDFSVFMFEGQQAVGTWAITGGSAAYENLSGDGNVTLDSSGERVMYSGDVE
jgi:hypothetical protein